MPRGRLEDLLRVKTAQLNRRHPERSHARFGVPRLFAAA
jgi:hypothetical protein